MFFITQSYLFQHKALRCFTWRKKGANKLIVECFQENVCKTNIKSTTSLAKISNQSAQKLESWCETLNVSQKELFTSCVAFAHHTFFLYCEIVLAYRLYCKKFLCFVFASILQSNHYSKSMHRTITTISHCQHSHKVIHFFQSSTK